MIARRATLLAVLMLLGCDDPIGTSSDASPATASDARVLDGSAPSETAPTPDAAAQVADDATPERTEATLTSRAPHLLEAISKNSPDLATDILFPRDAYIRARDDKDPARAWDDKVKTRFEASVRSLSRRVKGIERAVFVSFEIGKHLTRIVTKKAGWKESLYQVKLSTLAFTIDGKSQKLVVAEMVSWRGHWYVTKLR